MIELSINFTNEKESNNTIAFLDIQIIKSLPRQTHLQKWFYFHHNSKIKTGFIICFYLQALRIWSPQYLDEEFKHIKQSLKSLNNLNFFTLNARKKLSTYNHQLNIPTIPITHRHISLTHITNLSMTNQLN